MRISIWVPGVIPPGLVERAVEAAWPGAHAVTAVPALPAGVLATGGTLRLARPEILPLQTGLPSDPLRALAEAAAAPGDGEHAVLQILARPVTGGRLRRARRLSSRLLDGAAGEPARRKENLQQLRCLPAPADDWRAEVVDDEAGQPGQTIDHTHGDADRKSGAE